MKHFTFGILKQLYFTGAFVLGLTSMPVYGQTYEWASAFQGDDNVYGQNVVTDSDGSVYATGYFYDTVDFDPGLGTFDLISPGLQDIYVTKLDANGDLIWAHRFGNADRNRGNNITVDDNGDIYITGYFEGTVDFDPGPVLRNLTSVNIVDAFLLKLDSNGNFLWVRQYGSTVISEGLSITVDNNGNVLVGGYFRGDCDFDIAGTGYALSSVNSGNRDSFITKHSSNGDLIWVRHMGGAEDGRTEKIVVDANNNIYGTGFYEGTWDFDLSNNPGTQMTTSNGFRDIYVFKLSESGFFQWVVSAGDTGDDRGNGITLNNSGNLFITGQFEGTVDFNPGGTPNSLTATGIDSYVWSIDDQSSFNWINRIGGGTDDIGYDISSDPFGSVYVSGFFTGTANFDGTTTRTTTGGKDIFISKYFNDGTLSWVNQMGDAGDEFGFGIHVSDNWDVLSTGFFELSCNFDIGGTNTTLNSVDLNDAYITKLTQTCISPVFDSINYTADDTLFCPSASASTQLIAIGDLNDAADWEWYTGGCGMTHVASGDTVTFMPTTTTTYYVRAEGGCGVAQACDSITIYVEDLEAPVADAATLNDITEICEVTSLMTPTATDACEGTIQGTHDATLPITSNSTITWTYTDASGNSSIQTQEVILTGVDVSTTVNEITLIANNSTVGVAYRWIDCNNNNSPILNATNQSYTPNANGSYAVIVLQDNCQDTSDCIEVTTVGLEDYSKTNVNVYPNPSTGEFNIELGSSDAVNYMVTDNTGRIALQGTFEELENTIDLSKEEKGLYFLSMDGSVKKLVVQ